MSNLVSDVFNQILDAAGVDFTVGDPEEGTLPAQKILRAYGQCRDQLLRSANWAFARKEMHLTMLADATGQTPNVGTQVPRPWLYSYAYEPDCLKVRFIMHHHLQATPVPTGNIQPVNPSAPLTTGMGQSPSVGMRIRPARFVVATDPNYPSQPGQDIINTQGISPQGSTVILTNVLQANCVYTARIIYPSLWDVLFRGALVAYIASEVAVPLAVDKKFGMEIRNQQIAIAKSKIEQARLVSGNEGVSTSDIRVDWMDFRNAGRGGPFSGGNWGWGGGEVGGVGGYGGGWDSLSLADGSVF